MQWKYTGQFTKTCPIQPGKVYFLPASKASKHTESNSRNDCTRSQTTWWPVLRQLWRSLDKRYPTTNYHTWTFSFMTMETRQHLGCHLLTQLAASSWVISEHLQQVKAMYSSLSVTGWILRVLHKTASTVPDNYLPAYSAQIRNIETSHSVLYICSGDFSMQFATEHSLSHIPVNQITEMVIKKHI